MPESWWDSFSNNLATDLAPLIALFGEQPTKQYLSECTTIEDIIIFAIAPLGIITAVVSAIRVCGTPSLRAFVGRAQEGAGAAEAELCSSTSRDVCELYNNGGIARVFGRPKLLEIVHDPRAPLREFYEHNGKPPTAGIYQFRDYVATRKGKEEWTLGKDALSERTRSADRSEKRGRKQIPPRFAPNPNLSLNIGIKPLKRYWFRLAAAVGIILQMLVLVWAGLTRYYFQWVRDSMEDRYAFPMTIAGTILLCTGMALCANLIESITEERVYKRHVNKEGQTTTSTKMYWVQPGNQTIGDQVFDSFAFSDEKNPLQSYITSWKDTQSDGSSMTRVWAAVLATAIGFVCQFLGLRACHSSVAVMQLAVTVAMSIIRALLRTQRLKREENLVHPSLGAVEGHELDFLALKMVALEHETLMPGQDILRRGKSHYLWGLCQNQRYIPWAPSTSIETSSNDAKGSEETGEPKIHYTADLIGFGTRTSWNSEEEIFYRITGEPENSQPDQPSQRNGNLAEKALWYRSRLARMTEASAQHAELSSHWGPAHISSRDIASTLAGCIDDTMEILFSSKTTPPVSLHEGWEGARAIFIRLPFSLTPNSCSDPQAVKLSLRRVFDRRKLSPRLFKCDKAEIEAVLGLWLWSLKDMDHPINETEEDTERADVHFSRILAVGTRGGMIRLEGDPIMIDGGPALKKLSLWRGSPSITEGLQLRLRPESELEASGLNMAQNQVWWRDRDAFITDQYERPPEESDDRRRFFGWNELEKHHYDDKVAVSTLTSDNSLDMNCAQEIYAIFLDAILQSVKDIGGTTSVKDHEAINSNVEMLQNVLTSRRLCDAEFAFACTTPILLRKGVLKTPEELGSPPE